MAIHITVTLRSTLFSDKPEQEIQVRPELTIARLITEIQREYRLSDSDYCLTLGDDLAPLPYEQTLQKLGIRTGAVLVFSTNNTLGAGKSMGASHACLRASTGQVFELRRQRALIGRPNIQAGMSSEMLDVDLSALDPDRTTSRPHARISYDEGQYYLESLRNENRAYVNEQAIEPGIRRRLVPGEWLRFGAVRMQFLLGE